MSHPINPWKDFASYNSSDARYFKGREESIAKFLRIVDADTMSVLYASSGIGKTSFIQAGIVPAMIERSYAPIHILFTDDDFAEGVDLSMTLKLHIEDEIKKHNENEDKTREEKKKQNEDYTTNKWGWDSLLDVRSEEIKHVIQGLDEKSLWWKFHACEIKTESGQSLKPLLLLDQFEEVFVKAKIKNVKLQSFFDEIEELSSNNLPSEVENVLNQLANQGIFFDLDTHHHYKIIFSLRKEYLSDFDYWTNDRHSIAELQQNRMLLLPLSRTKAMKVIKEQPLNVEGSECYTTLNNIAEEILNVIDDKQRNEIEPFILSVLCSRLFDRATSLGKTELGIEDLETYTPNTIIREFYEQKINSIISNKSHLGRLEEELVDDDGKRCRTKIKRLKDIEFSEKYKKFLVDSHLIRIDNYNNEDYVELVHDRVADAVMERRQESTKRKKLIFARIASFVVLLGILFFTYYYMQVWPTSNKQTSVLFPYLLYLEDSDKSPEENNCKKSGDYNVEEIKAWSEVDVSNCPNLRSIHMLGSTVRVNIRGCEKLVSISFESSCEKIELSIADCPKLNPILIPAEINDIRFTSIPPNTLTFRTEDHGIFVWKDNVLWNTKDTTITYARYDAKTDITPPISTKKDTIEYQPKVFANADRDSITLLFSTKYSDGSKRLYKYAEELNLQDITCDFIKELDLSKFPNLRKVVLPNSLKEINTGFFKGCSKLKSVILPDSLSKIHESAFEDCRSLQSIVFPDSLHYIANKAFHRCSSIKELVFPDSLCVDLSAFDECKNLERVCLPRVLTIPSEIKEYPDFLFKGCPKVKFIVDKTNHNYSLEDDGTIVVTKGLTDRNGNVAPVLLINSVNTHTYKSNTFRFWDRESCRYYSKNGILYYEYDGKKILTNAPHLNIVQGYYSINVSKEKEIVYIPLTTRQNMFFFNAELDNCKEIHYPYPTIEESHKDLLDDIPLELKQNITLYVPYGALPHILQSLDSDASTWKGIQEESRMSWMCFIFLHHLNEGWKLICSWGIWPFIIIGVTIFAILMIYYLRKEIMSKATVKGFIKFTLLWGGTIVIGVITWYTIYWFVFFAIGRLCVINPYSSLEMWLLCIISNLISICFAIYFVYIVLYSDGFSLKDVVTKFKHILITLKYGMVDTYTTLKTFSWKSFECKIKNSQSKFKSKILIIFNNIINSFLRNKRVICFTFIAIALASGSYIVGDKILGKNKQNDIQRYCTDIIDKNTISDAQIKNLRNKLIDIITVDVRKVYPISSLFKELGDSLFLIADGDSCHYINFSDFSYGDVNMGIVPQILNMKSNFYLSDCGRFVSYESYDSVRIWPKDKLSQKPFIFRTGQTMDRPMDRLWFENDKFGLWITDNGFSVFNTEVGHIQIQKSLPYGYKYVGCLNKKYIVFQEENELNLYRLKDGKLLDRQQHSRHFSKENSIYCISNGYGIDSTFICRVIDDKLKIDTIPHSCDFAYKKYIRYRQNDSIFAYHVPTKKICNLGYCKDARNYDSLFAVYDGTTLKLYNFGDTLSLLKNFENTESCPYLNVSNHFVKLSRLGIFNLNTDTLQQVSSDDLRFEEGGWYCSSEYRNGYEIYSLDDFNAGSYRFTANIQSSILRGGWCFVSSDENYKLFNVKSIKLLIKESKYINDKQKKQLYELIDKHDISAKPK